MIRMVRGVLVLLLVLGGTAMAAPLSPTETLKAKNEELSRLLRQPIDKDPVLAEKQQHALRQLTDALFDYETFARLSLSEHWNNFKRRQEFMTVFKKMLENRHLQQLRTNLGDEVKYESQQVAEKDGKEATVTTLVLARNKGRSTDTEIIYKLRLANDTWTVWDIISDEVSLVRNYKTQFHKIISEQGPDKLIEKIKSKL